MPYRLNESTGYIDYDQVLFCYLATFFSSSFLASPLIKYTLHMFFFIPFSCGSKIPLGGVWRGGQYFTDYIFLKIETKTKPLTLLIYAMSIAICLALTHF